MQLRGALAEGDLDVAVTTCATSGRALPADSIVPPENTGSHVGATSTTELCEAGATLIASGGGAEGLLLVLRVNPRTP